MTPYRVVVPSANRPFNVPVIQRLCDPLTVTWYVPAGMGEEYQNEGARAVVECDAGEPPARVVRQINQAMQESWASGHAALVLDDDLKKVTFIHSFGPEGKQAGQIRFKAAADMVMERLDAHPRARLAGVYPVANTFYGKQELSFDAFIRSSFMIVKPCDLLLDESIPVKYDYDYTLAHCARYSAVVRSNDLHLEFPYKQNRGGFQTYRTAQLEAESVARLKAKWPGCVRDNPRRENEILIRWPPKGS